MRVFLTAFLCLFLVEAAAAEPVRVAAAISLKEAMSEVADAYAAEKGDKVEFTFGSSGQLVSQIKAGAPIDVFVSAANKQVDDLVQAGLVDEATRRVVTGNALVLIVPADSKLAIAGFQDLTQSAVTRIAAGEPKTVPAGQYAEQTFQSLGLTEQIKTKLVYGTNVRQVLDYVERGEVAAGVVYKTDALESGNKVKVVATARPKSHEPIVYPAVVVKASVNKAAAARFLEFIVGAKAQAILKTKGFTEPKERPAAPPATQPSSLRIEGDVPTPVTMTPERWAGLARESVTARDHDGESHTFEGVALARVLEVAGVHLTSQELRGTGLSRCLLVEAADGYRVVFALPELSSDFTDRKVLLADRRDGAALAGRAGPLQLIVPDEKRQARWVRQVILLRIADAAAKSEHAANN